MRMYTVMLMRASLALQMVVGSVAEPFLPLAFQPSSVNFTRCLASNSVGVPVMRGSETLSTSTTY